LNDFVEFFSRCQDELVSSEDYQRYADGLAAQLENERAALDDDTLKERAEEVALQQEIARAYRASEELLREKKRVSALCLIAGLSASRKQRRRPRALQEKYRYVLVDEFRTPISRNSASSSCWPAIKKTSSPSATTIRPSTASVAPLSAASSYSSNALPAGAKAKTRQNSASRSSKIIALRPTSSV
jgi:hypothetical protein